MVKSKLIAYLKTLSVSEMRELGQHIDFKSSNDQNDIVQLFKYLKKMHPVFPEKKIAKEYLINKIFKNEANKNKKLLNSVYRLNLLIDDFFVQKVLEKDLKDRDFLLLKALNNRKLDKYFFKKIETTQEDWDRKPIAGIDHLYDEYKLKEMCFSHPNYSLVKAMPDLSLLINQIDKHYFATKLYLNMCLYNNENYISKKKHTSNKNNLFIDEIINLSKNNTTESSPQSKLFGQLLNALKEQNYKGYNKFKSDFFDNLQLYNYEEKSVIQICLYHACYENYKIGIASALDLFELNCFAVEHKMIIEGDYISNTKFWNIIHIGFAAQKLDWTKKIIEEYGKYLVEEQREDTILICKAMLAFNDKQYENALQILATAKFHNTLYALYAKSLQLQCYYELDDDYENLFWNLCKSFNSYLTRREEFSESTKTSFLNFITFARYLQKAKYDPDKDLISLSKKINNNSNIAYKTWVLQKLEEQVRNGS